MSYYTPTLAAIISLLSADTYINMSGTSVCNMLVFVMKKFEYRILY